MNGVELALPALFLAGIQTSPHCAVMCGGFNMSAAGNLQRWSQVQALRALSYTLLGGAAGLLGSHLLWLLPQSIAPQTWRLGLGGGVLLLGLVLLMRNNAAAPNCHRPVPSSRRPGAAVTWGLMPCPALYLALGLAALSGHALNGALMLFAFALGTLPMHALQASAARWLARRGPWQINTKTRGILIMASGSIIMLSGWWVPGDAVLCRTNPF